MWVSVFVSRCHLSLRAVTSVDGGQLSAENIQLWLALCLVPPAKQ